MANPALATLLNPPTAASAAVQRLRESAVELDRDGMRGKDLLTDQWVTIVNIGRVLPETPPPGRMAPLLRAAARVANRAALILEAGVQGQTLTTGERQALLTAADWSRAARTVMAAHARWSGTDLDVPGIDAWLDMLLRSRSALTDAMSGNLDPDDLDSIESTDPAKIEAARVLDNPPPPTFHVLFTRIDAQRWARLLARVHADIHLSQREFLRDTDTLDWGADSARSPIRVDTDGRAAIDALALNPLLYAENWDVFALAERLAAGVEVSL